LYGLYPQHDLVYHTSVYAEVIAYGCAFYGRSIYPKIRCSLSAAIFAPHFSISLKNVSTFSLALRLVDIDQVLGRDASRLEVFWVPG